MNTAVHDLPLPKHLATPHAAPVAPPRARPHQGMPPLDESGAPLSFFEFWPMWAFYPPIMLYAAWLMLRHRGVLLPTAANPHFPGGGFYGESKAEILALARAHLGDWVAPFIAVDRRGDAASQSTAALQALADAQITLPVVAKPDLGCRGAGVKLVRSAADLLAYLARFPQGARLILQRLVPHEGEAGIFYCRRPGEARGRIVSVTLKYFPHVHGDGRHTLRELIERDPRAGRLAHLYLPRHEERLHTVPAPGEPVRLAFAGSHSRGAIFRNGTHLVTPAMEARFEALARRLPEFHFGRFDIRFAEFAELQKGEGFTIVEINGAGAESTHIWDRRTTIWQAWRDLMRQYRWLFEIGAANRARGFAPTGWRDFVDAWRREKALTPLYPPTD
ncbi:MAG: hypothetical protein KIT17_20005 [Rubrivivax sp.]|nr:hypothetical protein [Rubrivivax sp.]